MRVGSPPVPRSSWATFSSTLACSSSSLHPHTMIHGNENVPSTLSALKKQQRPGQGAGPSAESRLPPPLPPTQRRPPMHVAFCCCTIVAPRHSPDPIGLLFRLEGRERPRCVAR